MAIQKTSTHKYKWIILVKILVLLVCGWFIYQKISNPERFGEEFTNIFKEAIDLPSVFILIGVIFLMPFNWLFEAMKWRLLARPHSDISIGESFRGVMSGLSLGFITPHGVGDYVGRLLSLSGRSRSQLIGSVWLGRVFQMFITALFGTVGIWMFLQASSIEVFSKSPWWWITLFVLMLVGVFLYCSRIKFFGERIRYYFSLIRDYRVQDYFLLFLYSLGRYIIFSTQYLLILYVFEIPLPTIVLFGGISWMFLMKSVVPSFNFLSDLGVRELSVLTFFDLYNVSQPAILTSSLLLWMINILIPVLIGLYFVFRLNIKAK